MFTNRILQHRRQNVSPDSLRRGAGSFKRMLGCAPQVIARVRPPQELRVALTVADLPWNCEPEWTAARDSPRAPRPKRNGTFIWKALQNRTEPPRRMPASDSEPTTWVFRKRLGLGRVAQPNESRLSCGALKNDSFRNLRAPSASSAC